MQGEKRDPVTLYEVPLLSEPQIKSLIIRALPQAKLSPEHIKLRKKDNKYQAFVMVPSTKVDQICATKTLLINKQAITIKKPYTQAQVFIKRIPDTLSIEEVKTIIQQQFGKISKIHEGQPFEQTKSKFRHCYIQFVNEEDAEKCIFHKKKIISKGSELRPSRTYAMTEGDQTDKKLFLKIVSQIEDQDELEQVLNEQFRKEGKLREKIRVDNGKAIIIFTSAVVADQVLHNFKSGKIGKYEVVLRPYANKDSYSVFMANLFPTVTSEQLMMTFDKYQPILSCNILLGKNPNQRNATITFSSKQAYNRLLSEYKDDQQIRTIFIKEPYITLHMSARDRNEYQQYVSDKKDRKPKEGPIIPQAAYQPILGPNPYVNQNTPFPMGQMGQMGPMGQMGQMGPMGQMGQIGQPPMSFNLPHPTYQPKQ